MKFLHHEGDIIDLTRQKVKNDGLQTSFGDDIAFLQRAFETILYHIYKGIHIKER